MAKLTEEEILSIIDSEFESSMGAPGGEISNERARAWDYYMSKPLGNEIEGQSQVVTSDVSDVVDGMMPSLLRMFTTRENLVSFDAVGPEDEESAQQESDYVNYIFFKKNPAFEIMYSWFFDALVQKNGIVKAWFDKSEVVTSESYRGLLEEEVLQLLQDEELEPIERGERIVDGITLHDIEFKRVCKKGQIRVENVPPEEYRISSDARSIDPCSARMVGQERAVTRSDLISVGFDKDLVMGLPTHGEEEYDSEEKIARYSKAEEDRENNQDPSQELVQVREAYIKIDMTGKGRSELRQIFTAGGKILSNEPADRQPFHVICPQPLPHKHFGRCPAERVIDIQEVNSTILRQTLMNLYHTNNPKKNVNEQRLGENTLDDLMSSEIGGINRFNGPLQDAYSVDVVPFAAASSFPMMEYWDRVKNNRVGIHGDADGLAPDQLKHVQQSVMAPVLDLSSMKQEAIARIFAETGIKSLFLHIHELVLKHQDKAEIVKLRNTWVQIDPRSWRNRHDMTVNIGLGIGTKDQNLRSIAQIAEAQEKLAALGLGVMVTPQNAYNTVSELVKNANYKDPSFFFTDPSTLPPEAFQADEGPDPQMEAIKAQMQIEMAKLQQKADESDRKHLEAIAKIREESEARQDKLFIELEKLTNDLLGMELDYNKDIDGNGRVGGLSG